MKYKTIIFILVVVCLAIVCMGCQRNSNETTASTKTRSQMCLAPTSSIESQAESSATQDVVDSVQVNKEGTATPAKTQTVEPTISTAPEPPMDTQTHESVPVESPAKNAESESNHTHNYTRTVIQKANCSTQGIDRYTCICGDSFEQARESALGHHLDKFIVIKEATRNSEGVRQAKCRDCDYIETEIIPKQAPSNAELYAGYIDSRLTINRNAEGWIWYTYHPTSLSVTDRRTWGEPPRITVTENEELHICYYKQDGSAVAWTLNWVENYHHSFVIIEDGTYYIGINGDFSD